MPEPPRFTAAVDSNSRRTPVRVAFLTRRTSPQVKVTDEDTVMTWPNGLFRALVAIELLVIGLIWLSILWDAPLEAFADPMLTPNPAKAPWYFLGLQELLHYFPPVVAGVLIPSLVLMALVVVPYFNINVESEGVWAKNRQTRLRVFGVGMLALVALLLAYKVYAVLAPTVLIGAAMLAAAQPHPSGRFAKWLASKPLSFWIVTWFLIAASVLTVIGTFFRGPGWAWVWPWEL